MFQGYIQPGFKNSNMIGAAQTTQYLRIRPDGLLRPDVVLYGEHQSNEDDIAEIVTWDLAGEPDALLVMGSSLSIPAFQKLVRRFAVTVRKSGGLCVLINRTDVASHASWRGAFHYHVKGEIDDWVGATVSYWHRTLPSDWDLPDETHNPAS